MISKSYDSDFAGPLRHPRLVGGLLSPDIPHRA